MNKLKNRIFGAAAVLLMLFSGSAGAFHHHDISHECGHESPEHSERSGCAVCHHITHANVVKPVTQAFAAPSFLDFILREALPRPYDSLLITSYVSRAPPSF